MSEYAPTRLSPPAFLRIRSFWFGLTIPWTAFKLIISKKSLLLYSLIPIGVTLVLYYYLIGYLTSEANQLLTGAFSSWGIDPSGWLAWFMFIFSQLILFVVAALTFTFASSMVASPFNDYLAEKSERFAEPALSPVQYISLKHQIKLIGIDLIKTVAAACAGIAALLFSFVPVLNVITFIVAFLLVTFQYISYPQTRRGVPLKVGARFLGRHFFVCCGFGMTVTFFFAIPFAASFMLPVAVVGGTLLFARAQGSNQVYPLK